MFGKQRHWPYPNCTGTFSLSGIQPERPNITFSLDNAHQPELITIISKLLRDRSPLSIGSVVVAFEAVCPTRLDLLHPHYRRLCRTLIDVDEWGQADILTLLTRYARTMLPRPLVEPSDASSDPVEEVDQDLKLLLTSSEPLYHSNNPAVRNNVYVHCIVF